VGPSLNLVLYYVRMLLAEEKVVQQNSGVRAQESRAEMPAKKYRETLGRQAGP